MYETTLAVHSLLRWLVLAAGLAAFAGALTGRRGSSGQDRDRAGFWFVTTLDLQMLLGLLLYFVLSPITRIAFSDFGAAMASSTLRFWAVEHIFGMVVAMALVHIGRIRIRRATSVERRKRLAAIFYGLALVAIVATIPWPGTPAARPLFRGF